MTALRIPETHARVPLTRARLLHARRGFSLMELVIVLALLGLTAGVAAPALQSALRADATHESVRAVRTLLEDARSIALARGGRVELVVDSTDLRYWLIERGAHGDSVAHGTLTVAADARLELRSARAHFAWNVRGAAAGDTLVLATSSGRTVFTVDPWTGAVQLHAQ